MPRKAKPRTTDEVQSVDNINTDETPKKERKINAWIQHCKKVKKENESMLYKDVLKLAKESYKKP